MWRGQSPLGGHGVALALERGREDLVAGADRIRRLDDLFLHADPVVDILELPVLEVKRVTAESGAVGEQHAGGVGCLDLGLDGDRVRAVSDVGRNGFCTSAQPG